MEKEKLKDYKSDIKKITAEVTKEKIEICPKCDKEIRLANTEKRAEEMIKRGSKDVLVEYDILICPKCNVTFNHITQCSLCERDKVVRIGMSFCPNGHYKIVKKKRIILQPISSGLYGVDCKWVNIDK